MKFKTLVKILILLTVIGAAVAVTIYLLNKDNFEDNFDEYFDDDLDELFDEQYFEMELPEEDEVAEEVVAAKEA